ncbi:MULTISPECIES: LysR family transcriptional regulator [Paraburkholderia]|uniref:Transcriptional regulator, LysR family n=1 Tax=Paraburkholderia phenazinium TaxID=60549 RepID=A0A1N6GIL6_9BURK|nr:LysR family transcriptional regulator [Paraburkholderia phenazinium]SIO07388.1 transcriptional regulator, LysR family [Paraburkholderia phenazinium]
MDKLVALNTLLEVAEAGGFSKAAQRLGVATSSVTRLMDALEASLGTALLTRTTRRVSLTDAGTAYVEQISKVLDDLAVADDSIFDSGASPVGVLRISVPTAYSRLQLAPHLASFLATYPRMVLDVVVGDYYVDLAAERIDVAVRIGLPSRDEHLVIRKLADNARFVVASPAYFARCGLPSEPQELAAHECLRFGYGGTYRPARQIWTFLRGETEVRVEVEGRMIANNPDILLEAVLAGRGIALLPEWLVAAEIRAGRLVRLFADAEINPHAGRSAVYAAYLPNRRHSSKVRTFVQFLQERVQGVREA